MRKRKYLIICLLIALIISGCSNKTEPSTNQPQNNGKSSSQNIIHFSTVSADNSTPEGAAKMFVTAMINNDLALMKEVNRRIPGTIYSAEWCLEVAQENGWSRYDMDYIFYRSFENGVVLIECVPGEGRPQTDLDYGCFFFTEENGRWYFDQFGSYEYYWAKK